MPGLKWSPERIDYNTRANNRRRIKENIAKAEEAIPDTFKEDGGLNEGAIQAAKGKPEYRFDDMNKLYIVEFTGSMGNPMTGLFYLTFYTGSGQMKGVFISNNENNNRMVTSNGSFEKGEREYKFFNVETKSSKGGKRTRKHRSTRKHRKHTRKH